MNETALTIDVDWAPDFLVDQIAGWLIESQVPATWFITHDSPALDRLRRRSDLFELAIHPNFLPGSSHGTAPAIVLKYCMELVPEAVCVRTHGLLQSTQLLETIMEKTTIEIDVSLLLPHAAFLEPVEYYSNEKRLIRIPYFWEDDLEMQRPVPCWRLTPLLEGRQQGLKVFDFHPVHLYLNAPNMGPYQALKDRVPVLSTAAPSDLAPFVQSGEGPRTLFLQILASQRTRRDACRIKDIGERWLLSTRG